MTTASAPQVVQLTRARDNAPQSLLGVINLSFWSTGGLWKETKIAVILSQHHQTYKDKNIILFHEWLERINFSWILIKHRKNKVRQILTHIPTPTYGNCKKSFHIKWTKQSWKTHSRMYVCNVLFLLHLGNIKELSLNIKH